MSKIGIYYAYWTHDWDADFHPFIDRVAALGFDILEINAGTVAEMSTQDRRSLKAHAVDQDISLSYCIGLQKQYDPASEDESVRRNGVAYLQKMVEAIGEVGGGNLGGILYSYWPATLPEGVTDKHPYVERSVASMKEAAKALSDAFKAETLAGVTKIASKKYPGPQPPFLPEGHPGRAAGC